MDKLPSNQTPSVKQRLQALLGTGVGSLVIATASLVPQSAEATTVKPDAAQRSTLSDRVREVRQQIGIDKTVSSGDTKLDDKELLAWHNWGNWHNWHNWRSWRN